MHLADVARLAFDRVAEDVRAMPASRADRGRGFERDAAASRSGAPRGRRRRGSPGLSVSPSPLSQQRARRRAAARCRSARRIASASAQVVGSGTVGPAGDVDRVVARHVGDQQRDDLRRMARRRQPAALDRRQVPAHAVHLGDGARRSSSSAWLMRLLVVQASGPAAGSGSSDEPPPEIRHSTRSSARQAARQLDDALRGASSPASSGTGCAASTISMRPARRRRHVAVARDDEARQRSPRASASSTARAIAADALPAPMHDQRGPSAAAAGAAARAAPAARAADRGVEHAPQQRAGRLRRSRLRAHDGAASGRSRSSPASRARAPCPNDPMPCRRARRRR